MLLFHADLLLQYCSSDEFRLMSGKSLHIQRQRICVIASCKSVNWTYILTEQAKQTQEDFVSIILRYSDACLEEKQRIKHSALSKKIMHIRINQRFENTLRCQKLHWTFFSIFFFFFFFYYHVIGMYNTKF